MAPERPTSDPNDEPSGQAECIAGVRLAFSDWEPTRHLDDPLYKDLSAITRTGRSLFVACDETASVERLQEVEPGLFGEHRHYPLGDLVDLPAGPDGEMDIEGLCATDNYLWVIGSHALKRKKRKRKDSPEEALSRMEEVEREANRYFLGRLPLVEAEPGVFEPVREDGARSSAWIKFGKRNSKLMHWLRDDAHLAPFLHIPSKENGLDIEGIAARGNRVWLGTRGPVLRAHAVVLDLELEERSPTRLRSKPSRNCPTSCTWTTRKVSSFGRTRQAPLSSTMRPAPTGWTLPLPRCAPT
jgi:hypothetical protein